MFYRYYIHSDICCRMQTLIYNYLYENDEYFFFLVIVKTSSEIDAGLSRLPLSYFCSDYFFSKSGLDYIYDKLSF